MLIGQYLECENHLERDIIKLNQVKTVKEIFLYKSNGKWADTQDKEVLEYTPESTLKTFTPLPNILGHPFLQEFSFIIPTHTHGMINWCK